MPKLEIIAHDIFQKGEECNTQSIKEALLREAVKQCDYYATDILIFLGSKSWERLISNEIKKVQLIFKNSGVDWVENKFDKTFINNNRIRSIATLTIEEDAKLPAYRNIRLVIEHGNC